MNKIQQLKQQFRLEPHPEGGAYKRHYQSDVMVPTARGLRHATSSISYMLAGNEFSAFHRIHSDETWAFHEGSTHLEIIELTSAGVKKTSLSPLCPIMTVPAQTWFAAKLKSTNEDDYVLCSCVVSPGFDFKDFEMANPNELSAQFPDHAQIIQELTRAEPHAPLPPQQKTTTIAILTAMDMEGDHLAQQLNLQPMNLDVFAAYGARCFFQQARGLDVYLIVNPGCRDKNNQIGTIAASQAATLAMEYIRPEVIVSAGVAGAYADGPYKIGDVIYATEVMLHGHYIPLESLQNFGQTIYGCTRLSQFEAKTNVKLGTLSSGNGFLSALQRRTLEKNRQADVEDMEAGAIAQVLEPFTTVDFICLKAVTNLTGVPQEQEYAESINFDDNLATALTALSEALADLLQAYCELKP